MFGEKSGFRLMRCVFFYSSILDFQLKRRQNNTKQLNMLVFVENAGFFIEAGGFCIANYGKCKLSFNGFRSTCIFLQNKLQFFFCNFFLQKIFYNPLQNLATPFFRKNQFIFSKKLIHFFESSSTAFY